MIKDTMGATHPIFKGLNISVFWERVIGNVLLRSHAELEMFSELRRQAEELKRLQNKYAGTLSPLEDLPEDYLVGILRFRMFLDQLAKEWLNDLKTTAMSSPPLRGFVVRMPAENLNQILLRAKPGVKQNAIEKELVWLLQTLWEDGQNLFLARMPMVVDELERLQRAEPRARELISSYVAERIGDLSILCECLRQLEIFQPWANGYEDASVTRKEGLKKDLAAWTDGWAEIHRTMKAKPMLAIFALAVPEDKRFAYPTEKKRNKETVTALRLAESNLDAFWVKFDLCLQSRAGDLGKTALRGLLSQKRTLQRTPEWVAPPAPEKGKPAAKSAPVSEQDAIYRPLSTLYFGREGGPHGKDSQPKAKTKTRGTAVETLDQQLAADTSQLTPQQDQQPTFAVDARALKVFRMLFFQPAVTSTPGEVAWNDFLHAMRVGMGFRSEKLYGSVWHFQPTRRDVERSIQFHEPHPAGKIPFRVARRMGRRLARAYGWSGAGFVLEGK